MTEDPSEPDGTSVEIARLVAELAALRGSQHRLALAPLVGQARRAASVQDAEPTEPQEWLVKLLIDLRMALLSNPVAGQRVFAYLVAEGRRYAETDEGGRWLTALARDPLVERLRRLWEATSFNVFDEQTENVPPAWTQLIADALLAAPLDRATRAMRPPGLA
jgi:hypothetical protein